MQSQMQSAVALGMLLHDVCSSEAAPRPRACFMRHTSEKHTHTLHMGVCVCVCMCKACIWIYGRFSYDRNKSLLATINQVAVFLVAKFVSLRRPPFYESQVCELRMLLSNCRDTEKCGAERFN